VHVLDSTETTNPGRTSLGSKVRMLAIGAVATAALSLPAVSAVAVVSHDAARDPRRPPVKIDSQRLALSVRPASIRLT
jgi:hypothetical protein